MQPAEIALFLSGASLLISGIALGWNIFREIGLKPRLKVSVDASWVSSELQKPKQVIVISGTNFGPGKIRVSMVRWKRAWFAARLRKRQNIYGFQLHDYKNPLSGQLPTTLDVGERVDLVFPFDSDCLFRERPTHVGLRDYFGRDHFAPAKAVRKAQEEYDGTFGDESPNPSLQRTPPG